MSEMSNLKQGLTAMLLCCQGPGGAAQGAGHRERRHQGPHQNPAVPGEPHGWVRQ